MQVQKSGGPGVVEVRAFAGDVGLGVWEVAEWASAVDVSVGRVRESFVLTVPSEVPEVADGGGASGGGRSIELPGRGCVGRGGVRPFSRGSSIVARGVPVVEVVVLEVEMDCPGEGGEGVDLVLRAPGPVVRAGGDGVDAVQRYIDADLTREDADGRERLWVGVVVRCVGSPFVWRPT